MSTIPEIENAVRLLSPDEFSAFRRWFAEFDAGVMNEPDTTTPNAPGVTIEIPVRWGDMDALGHVNNIIYFQYCESARIAYFDAVRLDDFKQKPTDGPGLVAANLNFRKQMRHPGVVSVTANVTAVGGRSFTFSYVVRDAADGSIVADGTSATVWVDYEAGKALRIPDALVDALARIEQNSALRKRGGT